MEGKNQALDAAAMPAATSENTLAAALGPGRRTEDARERHAVGKAQCYGLLKERREGPRLKPRVERKLLIRTRRQARSGRGCPQGQVCERMRCGSRENGRKAETEPPGAGEVSAKETEPRLTGPAPRKGGAMGPVATPAPNAFRLVRFPFKLTRTESIAQTPRGLGRLFRS